MWVRAEEHAVSMFFLSWVTLGMYKDYACLYALHPVFTTRYFKTKTGFFWCWTQGMISSTSTSKHTKTAYADAGMHEQVLHIHKYMYGMPDTPVRKQKALSNTPNWPDIFMLMAASGLKIISRHCSSSVRRYALKVMGTMIRTGLAHLHTHSLNRLSAQSDACCMLHDMHPQEHACTLT